jgi:hypothetical protein
VTRLGALEVGVFDASTAISPDGMYMVGVIDGVPRLVNLNTGDLKTLPTSWTPYFGWSRDGQILVSARGTRVTALRVATMHETLLVEMAEAATFVALVS